MYSLSQRSCCFCCTTRSSCCLYLFITLTVTNGQDLIRCCQVQPNLEWRQGHQRSASTQRQSGSLRQHRSHGLILVAQCVHVCNTWRKTSAQLLTHSWLPSTREAGTTAACWWFGEVELVLHLDVQSIQLDSSLLDSPLLELPVHLVRHIADFLLLPLK